MHIIDLHTHSNYSDGMSSPRVVAAQARAHNVELFSLTDHDTVDGCREAREESEKLGLPFIPGVEVSTNLHDHLHILGLGVDDTDAKLLEFLRHYRERRVLRMKKVIEGLNKAGVDISYDEVARTAKATVSRAHVADLLKARKLAGNRHEAFSKYLIPGRPGYAPNYGPDISEAIAAIKAAGGVAVLAHPGVVASCWDFPAWTGQGLGGAEAFYPSHSSSMQGSILALAKKYALLATGGSDYHGPGSGRDKIIGVKITDEHFDAVKKRLFETNGIHSA